MEFVKIFQTEIGCQLVCFIGRNDEGKAGICFASTLYGHYIKMVHAFNNKSIQALLPNFQPYVKEVEVEEIIDALHSHMHQYISDPLLLTGAVNEVPVFAKVYTVDDQQLLCQLEGDAISYRTVTDDIRDLLLEKYYDDDDHAYEVFKTITADDVPSILDDLMRRE